MEVPGEKSRGLTTSASKLSRFFEKIYPYQLPAAFARTQLESLSALEIDSQPYPYQLTNIIATIGPVHNSVEMVERMLEAGCAIVRLNLSHGNYEDHRQLIENVRMAASKHWLPVCIVLDTRGPEIRTGIMKGGLEEQVELATGSMVTLTIEDSVKEACDDHNLWVDYKGVLNILDIGKKIAIDNGNITLVVREKGPFSMKCEVEYGGTLGSNKNVCFPGSYVDLPSVSEKDIQDIVFGVEMDVDVIFASFVRNADAVKNIRQILGEKGKKIKIFSKIENREGVKKFNEILESSDGIVVSRGKLGVEIPLEKVFIVQKMITARTMRAGKCIVCNNQMLNSMTKNPKPTRAEILDLANAVMDGVDSLALSSETSIGMHPLLCIENLCKVAKEAECAMYHRQLFEELKMLTPKPTDVSKCTAISAVEASIESMAAIIIVLTLSGRGAATISSYRPRCPIIAVTRDETTSKQLRLCRGVLPIWFKGPKASPFDKDVDARIQHALKISEQKGLVAINNFVVIVHSSRAGSSNTDSVRIIQYSRK